MRIRSNAPKSDFDHATPDYRERWPEIYRDMRANCPVLKSRNHGGYWVVSRYDDVSRVARDADTFSSGRWIDENGVRQGGISIPPNGFRLVPDETDQPEWAEYRGILNQHLGPQAVNRRRPIAQKFATALIDRVIETGRMDLVWDLTNPLPALVTMDFLGLPIEQWREYSEPYHGIAAPKGTAIREKAEQDIIWLAEELKRIAFERRKAPRDDLISAIATARRGGELLSEEELTDMLFQTLGGGVDTTTALTSNVLIYLHHHHDVRRRLIEEPHLRAKAREEFVRYFTPVMTSARTAVQEAVIGDEKISPGDRVLVPYCAANRDPAVFKNPEEVILDRAPNPHVGFGAGIHRCVGSNLARMMYDTMLNEVLSRLPDYVVDDSAAERYVGIPIVNGWMTMPATFTPGERRGSEDVLR